MFLALIPLETIKETFVSNKSYFPEFVISTAVFSSEHTYSVPYIVSNFYKVGLHTNLTQYVGHPVYNDPSFSEPQIFIRLLNQHFYFQL